MSDRRHTLLIVDDNQNNLFSLRMVLKRLPNCRILEADSGRKALEILLEETVDLVLLDVQMPDMNGFETAQHMQMTNKTRGIPVIFITAVFDSGEFIRHGYRAGAVDYITKPIDDNTLINRLNHYFRKTDPD
ncbi:MAG: response regulator [Magnetococcales bacterium]|nr:response regulator [Magnetococcales bacterium]